MKRILILTLAAGLLSAGTPALIAQVSTNSTGQAQTENSTAHQKQQDRRKLMTLIGLNSKDLKGLTAEDRRAKIKEATDQKIAQLQQKKTNGTLSTEEQSDLAFLEKRVHHGKAKGTGDN